MVRIAEQLDRLWVERFDVLATAGRSCPSVEGRCSFGQSVSQLKADFEILLGSLVTGVSEAGTVLLPLVIVDFADRFVEMGRGGFPLRPFEALA